MKSTKDQIAKEAIGKTSSPERDPNSTTKFYCWIKKGVLMNPFDFLVAEHMKGTRTVGIVTEILSPTDSLSHLSDYVSHDFGQPEAEPYTERLSSMIAEVNVLRNTGYQEARRQVEIMMPVPGDMPVHFAEKEDVRFAMGTDQFIGEEIPAGVVYQSNGTVVPVGLDSAYLLGPEGAHINASGISGLATKTSYLMFLALSVYQKLSKQVAFVIFNVKQADLLRIHEQGKELTSDDRDLYDLLDLECTPFENVTYFLPRGRTGRPDSDNPPREYELYAYAMSDVYSRFDLLFADVPDPYFTLDTFNSRVREDWRNGQLVIQASAFGRRNAPLPATVRNWEDLRQVNTDLLARAYNLHSTTPPRIRRELTRLTASPLFVNNRSRDETYLGDRVKKIKPGEVYVIDIARIHTRTQPFIVGDVMRSIDQMYREGDSAPKRMVIFVDELNSFAPSGGTSAIAEQIVEIARKGRSRGTVMFGAEQFKSEIHDQIVGNCGTHAIGRTGSAEVRRSAYAFLDERTRNNVMGLGKGEIVLSAATWRSPIKVRFPRPAYNIIR